MITLGLDQSEDPDEVSICLLIHKIDPVFQVLNNVVHVLHLSDRGHSVSCLLGFLLPSLCIVWRTPEIILSLTRR